MLDVSGSDAGPLRQSHLPGSVRVPARPRPGRAPGTRREPRRDRRPAAARPAPAADRRIPPAPRPGPRPGRLRRDRRPDLPGRSRLHHVSNPAGPGQATGRAPCRVVVISVYSAVCSLCCWSPSPLACRTSRPPSASASAASMPAAGCGSGSCSACLRPACPFWGCGLGAVGIGRLLVTGIALSIDNLAVGFALGTYHVNLAVAALVIGAVSVALSLIGLELGARIGTRTGQRGELLGGLILIAVGIAVATRVI